MKSNNPQVSSYWERFVNALSEAVLVLDDKGVILYVNHAACDLFNKASEKMLGDDFSYPIQLDKPCEIEILRPDKKIVYAEVRMKMVAWENTTAWIVALHDITLRKTTEAKLKILANVFNFAKEGILITDADHNIIDVNTEFTNITQYTREEVIGKNPKFLQSGIQPPAFYQALWSQLKKEGYWFGEIWNKKKNNQVYPQLEAISTVTDINGDITNYVGVFYDITQQEFQKKQLERIAHYDLLTSLPNRKYFIEHLELAMKKTERSKRFLAVAFLDLDGFKSINDNYGHGTGDHLLIVIAEFLKNVVREVDTVARLGGDEFVILIEELQYPADYKRTTDRIQEFFTQPFLIDAHSFSITASIGVTFYPQKIILSPASLISQADQAMYKCKTSGKNRCCLFDLDIDMQSRKQESLVSEMKRALDQNELSLYYEPKVNMITGKVFGVEGLIRWNHPTKGLLMPAQFLPSIKEGSVFFELTEFTIQAALNQIKCWAALDDHITISVNINAIQMEQQNFVERLNYLIGAYPKSISNRLELELLESSVIPNFKIAADIIERCNAIGIEFSLDDFGSEYSSINYLVNLPLKYMKVDVGFIRNIINNERDTKIFLAMLDIAKAINIKVIAEGVETKAHIDYLVKLGCFLGQGYAIAKAMPAEEFPAWYKAWNAKRGDGNHVA
ncbi:MAG: EAL domain-containing protein [Gammaproteobacteria bacterium]|nr:EAL domain-containing protein [Gammaproteobacteria bacterium]